MIAIVKKRLTKPLSVRARLASALITTALAIAGTPAAAQGTAEQRTACRPDVFRLCAGEIPNVNRIVACMQRKRSQLSPACAAVFDARAASN
jgi:hypothetical protein